MQLNKIQEEMLAGKEGRGVQKAMEILTAMGKALGAEEMVKITYAHLMPPDLMFFPYGKQGQWAREMTSELTRDLRRLKVLTTVEPKFCDLCVAKDLQFSEDTIEEIRQIQGAAVEFYEKLGVLPTYTAMPFYYYQSKLGQHVSIAEGQQNPLQKECCWLRIWFNKLRNWREFPALLATLFWGLNAGAQTQHQD